MVTGLAIYRMGHFLSRSNVDDAPPHSATSASLHTAKPDLKANGRLGGKPQAERELLSIPDQIKA